MQSHGTFATLVIAAYVCSVIMLCQCAELTYVINEEAPVRTRVGNVLEDTNITSFVSPAELTDLRFSFLTERNPQSAFLWINSTNGEIRTSAGINREVICPRLAVCELKINAVVQSLLGAFFKIVHVKVNITDINDNVPFFDPSTVTVKVSESETPGAYFRIPAASDLDGDEENSNVEYVIAARTAPFTLALDDVGSTPQGVRIRLDSTLDRETVGSYQLHVLAIDNGSPRLTGTLTVNIEVLDANDNAPIFQQQFYNVSVSDEQAVGSSILVVRAVDLDYEDNGFVTYVLPSTQEDMRVLDMFYINRSSGEIKVKASLDIYAGRSYRLAIQASDSGSPYKTVRTQMLISVLDTHNSPPEILLNVLGAAGVAQVSELAEIGRAVAHVAVTDPDSAQSPNGRTSCFLDNTDQFRLQGMDVQQFKVILTKRLDREQQTHHSITITCEDAASPPLNASSSFVVEVGDENDNAPTFSSPVYTVEVTEGKLNNDTDKSKAILSVQATDLDSAANAHITYRLADDADPDFGIFTDGAIVVTNPAGLDREHGVKGGVRSLLVLAVDSGKVPLTGTARVVITVKDINDNPPMFTEPVYFFTVREDSPLGHIVGSVSASDADLESSSVVRFRLHHRSTNVVPFYVSLDGAIKVSAGLDRETKSSYEFLVVAYDLGEPVSLSSTVVVRIKVSDVNDNSPKFQFPTLNNYTVYIPWALSKNTIFATLLATDLDEGINGELEYSVESVNGSKHFKVEPTSGQMFLAQPLTEKDIGVHVLTATALNPDAGMQVTVSVLHVIVYEGNSTVSHKPTGLGHRNTVVVVVLLVFTVVLAVTILSTILLLRFVDKDKQQKFYNARAEEDKIESKLKDISLYFPNSKDTLTSASDVTAGSRDGGRRRKEVSFSLEEACDASSSQRITNSSLSDTCVFSSDRVHGTTSPREAGLYQDDRGSDTSGDISTCDSGKGGSDVELQSHLGQIKHGGDVTLQSQLVLDHHSSLNCVGSTHGTTGCRHLRSVVSPEQLQNSMTDIGSYMFQYTPSSLWPRPSVSPDQSQLATHQNNINYASYNQNPRDNRFHEGMNHAHDQYNKENHYHHEQIKNQKRTLGALSILNQNNQLSSPSNRGNYLIELPEATTPSLPRGSNALSCTEEANMWDCDTTTSGSYVIDPSDLYSEIDSFPFGNIRDIVV
ncbi:hypothetical protein BsWGS_27630 [Bradybaena similaris]